MQIMGRGILLRAQRRKAIDSEQGEAGLWELAALEMCVWLLPAVKKGGLAWKWKFSRSYSRFSSSGDFV